MFIDEESVFRLHPSGVPFVLPRFTAEHRAPTERVRFARLIYKYCTPTECVPGTCALRFTLAPASRAEIILM